MEQNKKMDKQYDVVIVGLGCYGLGAAYELSKKGLKVIGFDRAYAPGVLGSSSVGYGSAWSNLDPEDRYAEMMKESEVIFREVEKKTGVEILQESGQLYIRRKDHPDLDTV